MQAECHPALQMPRPYVNSLAARVERLGQIVGLLKELDRCRYQAEMEPVEKKLKILVDGLGRKS